MTTASRRQVPIVRLRPLALRSLFTLLGLVGLLGPLGCSGSRVDLGPPRPSDAGTAASPDALDDGASDATTDAAPDALPDLGGDAGSFDAIGGG